jgi:hypothetical protein
VDWKTKKVMYQAGLTTLRVSFNDCTSPATAKWEDVSFLTTSVVSLDAILFTDRFTNRTFVSQLTGQDSLSAFTDNDGTTWTPSQGGGIPSGVDHETVGGGPFHSPLIGTVYADAVYYCSQDIATAFCARSDDGGATYGAGVPTWTLSQCGGLHGHVKVSPADGTVYVPNKGCGSLQAVAVSENNGVTWTVRPVPNISAGIWDPSVGIATDGTVYFGADDGNSFPLIAVSHDRGQTWSSPVNVGAFVAPQQTVDTQGVKQTAFPEVVAGDGGTTTGRAAFAFLGSTTFALGGGGDDPNWPGIWHLYVAHTYDGGSTYTTVDVTPNDPVQRNATICAGGFGGCGNGTRNLLDFNDASVDQDGRVVIGYADGCIGNCVTKGPNSFSALSTIARQVDGRRLFAASDVVSVPAAPLVQALIDCTNQNQVVISWSTPASNGSPITSYNVFKSINGGTFTRIASVPVGTNEYIDPINQGQTVTYKVTAVNAFGEGPSCSAVTPSPCPPPESPCVVPGVTVLTDAVGDALDKQPEHDIVKLSIAEPASLGPSKVQFILKMVSLQTVTANTTWPVQFVAPNGTGYAVRMHTNAAGQVFFTVATGANATNPNLNAGTPADPASGFNSDGTINIIVPRSVIGNPAVGQQLTKFLVRIRVEGAVIALTPDNMPDSTTPAGTYTIFGSENCAAACTAPTANPDSATTTENQPVVINVVANDTDGGSPPLTVTSVTQPSNGTASNNGNGTVTYAPKSGFVGTDSFTYTIKNNCGKTATGTVTVNVTTTQCFEDTDKSISYANGWHTINDSSASGGTFHLDSGNDQHAMTFNFVLQANSGTLQYFFATSTKGGSAQVLIDGNPAGTINYQGSSGSMHDPVFIGPDGKRISTIFPITGAGPHKFELVNLNGPAYVDKFCVTSGSSSTMATSGPGTTATSTNLLAVGGQALQNLLVPSNALGFSVAAEADVNVPYKLVVTDPTGKLLGAVNSSANGIASVSMPVSASGLYVIQLVNVGLGPVNIWTAATPQVTY